MFLISIFTLLLGISVVRLGVGMLGTLLGARKPGTFLFFFAGMLALLGYYAAYLIRRRTELPSRRRSRLCP